MRAGRRYPRFIRRLETEFTSNSYTFRGISGNFSLGGLFIRTNHAFCVGTKIDLKIYLPDDTIARLKGIVRMSSRMSMVTLKNGMGIEIIENDPGYINFCKTYSSLTADDKASEENFTIQKHIAEKKHGGFSPKSGFMIAVCQHCDSRNKVHFSKAMLKYNCGKCGSTLHIN